MDLIKPPTGSEIVQNGSSHSDCVVLPVVVLNKGGGNVVYWGSILLILNFGPVGPLY